MTGRSLGLSPGRRFIADLSWLARRVPQGVVRRVVDIRAARDARGGAAVRIPWTILVAKAWALAAEQAPALRRSYAPLPWPHLHEAEFSVATIMIERDWAGESALLYARLKQPERKTLKALAAELESALQLPVEDQKQWRAMRRANRLPWPLRRLLWLIAFNWGKQRPKFFGTFGVTVLGHRGLAIAFPVSPMTSVVTLGPFQNDGSVEVTIGFDHRVMDGGAVADALDAFERHLNGAVAAELAALKP